MKHTILLWLFCLLTGTIFTSELEIKFEIVKNSDLIVDQEKIKMTNTDINKDFKENITLLLGDNYFYVSNDKITKFYDFKNKIIKIFNLENKTFQAMPLYANLSFRIAEFENRLYLNNMYKMIELKDKYNPFNFQYIYEILFSLDITQIQNPEIKTKDKDSNIEFYINDKLFNEISIKNKNSIENFHYSFEKYLLYECNIHPIIRKEILSKNLIPDLLTYNYYNDFTYYSIKYNFISSKLLKVNTITNFADYTEITNNIETLEFYRKAKTEISNRRTKANYIEYIDDCTRQKKYFDSFLSITEYYIENGELLSEKIQEIKPYLSKSKEIGIYNKGLNYYSNKKYEDAIKEFKKINNSEKGYIVDIQLAVQYMMLDRPDDAIKFYNHAISKNPFLTGVYKDLGDLYSRMYNTDVAWKLYNIVLELSPDHPFSEEIRKNIEWYEINFKDFF